MMTKPLQVFLAQPRGFCAGVDRAIAIVEEALRIYGAPVYVRHEIVHNRHVVDDLKRKGAIFVKEVEEIPDGAITIFSAHGVSDAVEQQAKSRKLPVIDATCPLVTKVHSEARHAEKDGRQIILIGHEGHPEVEGTAGRVKKGVLLVSEAEDVSHLKIEDPEKLSYVTQTTLSVNDTKDVIAALKQRFPSIQGPGEKDICYATQNRQDAVADMAKKVGVILVVGAANSSNSNRLRDLGEEAGIPSYLISEANDINPQWLEQVESVGISAGASAPEILVQGVIDYLRELRGEIQLCSMKGIEEDVYFNLPREVRSRYYTVREKSA